MSFAQRIETALSAIAQRARVLEMEGAGLLWTEADVRQLEMVAIQMGDINERLAYESSCERRDLGLADIAPDDAEMLDDVCDEACF